MNRFTMLVAAAAIAAPISPAWAEKIPLAEISDYFNAMFNASSPFTQINDDGTLSTGNIMIRRPGRIRFEYDPPDQSLVMAGQGKVAVFDPKSNQPPERFPLTKTPLFLILSSDVDLGRANMVVGHTDDGIATNVIAQDPNHPEYGYIQLVFTGDPVELRQWVITDGSGAKTTLILGDLQMGGSMPTKLFDIGAEMEARGF